MNIPRGMDYSPVSENSTVKMCCFGSLALGLSGQHCRAEGVQAATSEVNLAETGFTRENDGSVPLRHRSEAHWSVTTSAVEVALSLAIGPLDFRFESSAHGPHLRDSTRQRSPYDTYVIGLVASRGRPSRHRWIPNSSHARRCPVPYSVVAALFGASRGVRGRTVRFRGVPGRPGAYRSVPRRPFRGVPGRSEAFRGVPVRSGAFRGVPGRSGAIRSVPGRAGACRGVPGRAGAFSSFLKHSG